MLTASHQGQPFAHCQWRPIAVWHWPNGKVTQAASRLKTSMCHLSTDSSVYCYQLKVPVTHDIKQVLIEPWRHQSLFFTHRRYDGVLLTALVLPAAVPRVLSIPVARHDVAAFDFSAYTLFPEILYPVSCFNKNIFEQDQANRRDNSTLCYSIKLWYPLDAIILS